MHAGEAGITIEMVNFGIDVSTAAVTLRVQPPSGVVVSYPMTIAGDGLSASYVTKSGDFAVAGHYAVELTAVFSSGQILKSDIHWIEVRSSL